MTKGLHVINRHFNNSHIDDIGGESGNLPRFQDPLSCDQPHNYSEPLTAAVAMSGGIDSAVAALLLSRSGWSVTGLHLILPAADFTAERRLTQARDIARIIGIPLHTVDLSAAFKREVIKTFVSSYRMGKTPNPCVVCNQRIKFEALSDFSREHGLQYISTGHYAVIKKAAPEKGAGLFRGFDPTRDQSYFLHRLSAGTLNRTVFPLGNLKKKDVIEMGKMAGISHIPQGESREICFIGEEGYRPLIEDSAPSASGNIVDQTGHILGKHGGIYRYTIGQRHGLGLAAPRPLYVMRLMPEENLVVVGQKEDLFRRDVLASHWAWTGMELKEKEIRCDAQIRYRHRACPGTLKILSEEMVHFRFDEPQWAVTPGQALVCYLNDRVIGGAWIERQSP